MTEDFPAPGQHLLLDFWGAKGMTDAGFIEQALRDAAKAAGATVLGVQLHHFGEGMGVTGVAMLAESHISIHTWPENDFIALDIFVCGECEADKAAEVLLSVFAPKAHDIKRHRRGVAAFRGNLVA